MDEESTTLHFTSFPYSSLTAANNTSTVANRALVLEERAANTASCFTQTQSLNDRATENHTQGNQTLVRNGGRASDNELETI